MSKPIQILVVSDNHGRQEPIEQLKRLYPNIDYKFHLGDSEMQKEYLDGFACVQGNNDPYGEYPSSLTLNIGGHTLLLIHGHRHLLFHDPSPLIMNAKQFGCDVVLYGHTHVYHDTVIDNIRFLNPGSIGRNRDGSMPGYMLVTIKEDGSITAVRKDYIRQ